MRRSVFSLLIGLFLLVSGPANASYFDFGLLGNPDLKVGPGVAVPACVVCGVDQFDFQLAAPAVVSASAFNAAPYVGFPVYALPSFFAVLVPGGVPPLPAPGLPLPPGFLFTPSPDGQRLDLFPALTLAAGNYSILVSGSTGPLGGLYAVSVATMPIPEPATAVMLVCGLGLIVSVARRRRNGMRA